MRLPVRHAGGNITGGPGMEGCHWSFRKVKIEMGENFLSCCLRRTGKSKRCSGWLIDYAGSSNEALQIAWKIVTGKIMVW